MNAPGLQLAIVQRKEPPPLLSAFIGCGRETPSDLDRAVDAKSTANFSALSPELALRESYVCYFNKKARSRCLLSNNYSQAYGIL